MGSIEGYSNNNLANIAGDAQNSSLKLQIRGGEINVGALSANGYGTFRYIFDLIKDFIYKTDIVEAKTLAIALCSDNVKGVDKFIVFNRLQALVEDGGKDLFSSTIDEKYGVHVLKLADKEFRLPIEGQTAAEYIIDLLSNFVDEADLELVQDMKNGTLASKVSNGEVSNWEVAKGLATLRSKLPNLLSNLIDIQYDNNLGGKAIIHHCGQIPLTGIEVSGGKAYLLEEMQKDFESRLKEGGEFIQKAKEAGDEKYAAGIADFLDRADAPFPVSDSDKGLQIFKGIFADARRSEFAVDGKVVEEERDASGSLSDAEKIGKKVTAFCEEMAKIDCSLAQRNSVLSICYQGTFAVLQLSVMAANGGSLPYWLPSMSGQGNASYDIRKGDDGDIVVTISTAFSAPASDLDKLPPLMDNMPGMSPWQKQGAQVTINKDGKMSVKDLHVRTLTLPLELMKPAEERPMEATGNLASDRNAILA